MKISIIVATCGRPDSLRRLVDSLAPQLVPGKHELCIAENGTPQPTSLLTAVPLAHLHEPIAGKCRIQNRAIARAQGEIVVCLDDDLVVAPDYIAAVDQFFRIHPHFAAMKGRVLAAEDPTTKVGPMAPYLDLPLVDHGEEVAEVRGVIGANMAFRAAALRQVGGFDERLGPGAAGHEEETEISQRLRRAGFTIGYAPRAIVYHDVDATRANRARFSRVARERGYCRTLHERHSLLSVLLKESIAAIRLLAARASGASIERIAREERRLSVARGMRDGLTRPRRQTDPIKASNSSP